MNGIRQSPCLQSLKRLALLGEAPYKIMNSAHQAGERQNCIFSEKKHCTPAKSTAYALPAVYLQ